MIADRFFQRRLKLLLVIVFVLATATMVLFTVALPMPGSLDRLIPRSKVTVIALISATGFFQAASDPLFYEIAAEASYPLPESLNGAVLSFVFNAAALVMLFVAPLLPVSWVNSIMSGAVLVCTFAVLAVRETYRRWTAGEQAAQHVSVQS